MSQGLRVADGIAHGILILLTIIASPILLPYRLGKHLEEIDHSRGNHSYLVILVFLFAFLALMIAWFLHSFSYYTPNELLRDPRLIVLIALNVIVGIIHIGYLCNQGLPM